MRWLTLLKTIGNEPVFSSGLLLAGNENRAKNQLQLTRWKNAGKIIQLRRGLYMLAKPHRKIAPHPFLIANQIKRASYVSMQSALEHYGLIPEYVPTVTSVTTTRTETIKTSEGVYIFRHVKKSYFIDYISTEIVPKQNVFIATPEKSLLDLIYFTPGGDTPDYLQELRLQNIHKIDLTILSKSAERIGSPKLNRAARQIMNIIKENIE